MADPVRVQGYHGTSIEATDAILREGFRLSRNEPDWLGDGVYFFLNGPGRAWDWATTLHGSNAAVIGSIIRLEDCMNLLEPQWSNVLGEAYDSFLKQLKGAKLPIPVPTSGAHRLDRAVINYTVEILAEQGLKIRVVQGVFREGRPIYPNSALFNLSHVQIAVRDTSFIESSWREPAEAFL
jgi:hypothetical protein